LTIASVITTAAPSKAQIPVVDPLGLSGGTFTLQTRSGVGKCVPHEGAADVRIGLADLATTYLGAHRPSQLLRAGRLTELRQDVVRDLDAAFSTDRIPFCGGLF
jgi:predicted acetyltransferase